ncbi:hypothetical protein [Aquisphaera giovannonii]|uniref:hypothetical protein n=1 Tax=Aquisphaera giovannonii TaxID=406548 RepID=UPI0011DF5C18|nr:hypothetical protein [Aquisphaera giovannonii]
MTVAGRLDSPEADAIRDVTDAPWEALTEVEKKRIAGLSEDLYSMTDPPREPIEEVEDRFLDVIAEILYPSRGHAPDGLLEQLRRWKDELDPALLSYLRGQIWLRTGDLATAALFFKHAFELRPGNKEYFIWYQVTRKAESRERVAALP